MGLVLQSSEPSSRSATSLGPGLAATVALLPHPRPCDLTGAAACLGYLPWGLVSLGGAWGAWGPPGLGSWLLQWGRLGKVGDLVLREPPTETYLLLAGWGPSRVRTVPWDLAFSSGQGINIHLVWIYRNIVTWPWPDLKNKGFDSR